MIYTTGRLARYLEIDIESDRYEGIARIPRTHREWDYSDAALARIGGDR